jgi:hypothetical protein
VPTKEDKPVLGLKTNKNFITSNAVEAILAVRNPNDKIIRQTRKPNDRIIR